MALLKTGRLIRKVLDISGYFQSCRLHGKATVRTGVKNSQGMMIISVRRQALVIIDKIKKPCRL